MAAADQKPHASAVRPRSYQDESYLRGFFGSVGDLQKAEELQDVVLEVEGWQFPCHRLVLSAASPYFRAMFTCGMAESRQKTVVLQGLDPAMFGEILSYMYSGTVHVSLDTVQPLYQAADLLQLDYLRNTCSSYMAKNVEDSTCVDLYKFADVFSVNMVLKQCLQYICSHFVKVASSEEFCSLSVNQLTGIISQDELDVKKETTVWEAVVRWVQHSREDRLHHLPSILPHIRFNLLTPYNMQMEAILAHPLVREDPGSSAIRNVVKETSNLKRRVGMDTREMALLFGDSEYGARIEMMWMNPREEEYITCEYNITSRTATVTSDNDIYILAEESDDFRTYALLKYNHVENKWEKKSSVQGVPPEDPDDDMRYEYYDYLMEVNGHLFYLVVKTSDSENDEVVLKKYNKDTNTWHCCSQPQHVGGLDINVAVSCNQHIYLFTRTEAHCYDPKEDHWCMKTNSDYIPDILYTYKAVAMGTEIIFPNTNFSKTMVYDTEKDRWLERPVKLMMNSNRDHRGVHEVTLFVLENKLHAVTDNFTYLSSSEEFIHLWLVFVYDSCEDVWRELTVLPYWVWYAIMANPMFPVARMYLPYLDASRGNKHL
ncbi:kelch repeat and BTB domain-containing protein 8-like [Branchiostoma floridae]|uniref:Kelch repeat and BTB domain-containing protein 8-like n=1 Tax=Branchiostoma floridae TaxID=7739 RepID=A0A9J7M6H6_BRAFL|nr:kelch repeat and BTB domain-containing protein 8-like [Branchiostoma floridae]